MNSKKLGRNTSITEVTHIDSRGLWLYVDKNEHYMPFNKFPWFADATIRQISRVERHAENHFHWPELDIDLTIDMIDHPDKYPKKYK